MIKNWFRRFLGITESDERIARLEEEKRYLEGIVIESERRNKVFQSTVEESSYERGVQEFLAEVGIKVEGDISRKIIDVTRATQVVEEYKFKRYAPVQSQSILSPIISFKDVQEHPELYLSRFSKGFMKFPVGLNISSINKMLSQHFDNMRIDNSSHKFPNGTFSFTSNSLFGGHREMNERKVLQKALTHAQLDRSSCDIWTYMDPVDFLSNYDALESFVIDQDTLDESHKTRAISALRFVKEVYTSAIEIVGTTRIHDASDLLESNLNDDIFAQDLLDQKNLDINEEFKHKIKSQLLEEPIGTSYDAIQSLLQIGSKERFRELASERTTEILSRDSKFKRLTYNIGKPLKEYTVGESVMLACYFARNIIERYSTLEDSIKSIIGGVKQNEISGKCTDYTGLALHYLREYLIPLHPEKFKNWKFGFDSDIIGNYRHCYMQVLHINNDQTVDVYFLDPTKLAKKGLNSLKDSTIVSKAVDTANLPIKIERYAEDLLEKKLE